MRNGETARTKALNRINKVKSECERSGGDSRNHSSAVKFRLLSHTHTYLERYSRAAGPYRPSGRSWSATKSDDTYDINERDNIYNKL